MGRFPIPLVLAALSLSASPALATGDLYATTTTYEVFGGTAQMSVDAPYTSVLDAYQIHSDALVRDYEDRWVFIINRLFADNILVLDRASNYSVVTQYSVSGTGLNPRDIHVEPSAGPGSAPGRAFIPLYESNLLLVCDALTGANATTIDLSVFADADGLCEMDQIVEVSDVPGYPEGLLFVSIQNQDRSGSSWVATDACRLALIDVATESLVDARPLTPEIDGIDLNFTNPTWRLQIGWNGSGWRVFVNCAGQYGVLDGGIEIVNPYTWQTEGAWYTEAALGGDILDFALLGLRTGWALRSNTSFQTSLVQFDPMTGTNTQVALASSGFDLSDIELGKDSRLFVSDRNATNPGVRIYDSTSGALLAGPLDCGLPPYDITVLDEIPTAAPPHLRSAQLSAKPNPFNPRVEIRLEPAGARSPDLEIVDLRGRRITRLTGRREGDGVVWIWDGRNENGATVASGAYFARPAGTGVDPVRLMLVR